MAFVPIPVYHIEVLLLIVSKQGLLPGTSQKDDRRRGPSMVVG